MATMATFTFEKTVGKPSTGGAVPPKSFLPEDAKKRYTDGSDGLRSYLPGYSSLVEILASRYHFVLNGCEYGEESFIPMLLRPFGWGCRAAFYIFSVVFIVLSGMREKNPIGQYSFSRERDDEGTLKNDETDAFEWFVYVTYVVWVTSILTEVLTYLVGRGGGGKNPHDGQCSAVPFLLCNRVSINGGEADMRCAQGMFLIVWFLGFGAAASTMMYTTLSHMFVRRNVYFSWLFVVFVCFAAFSALSDAISLGGIDGLAVQNRPASFLAAIRVVVVVPVTIIFSLFFLWLCSPPWSSI
jgi:hypothetical protein